MRALRSHSLAALREEEESCRAGDVGDASPVSRSRALHARAVERCQLDGALPAALSDMQYRGCDR